jgi:hypothetical protein
MATEYISDKNPQYIFNKHTTYENTILQEHSSIISGLRDTDTVDATLELQARLFIGACLKEKAPKFLKEKYDPYKKEEFESQPNVNTTERTNNAINRTYVRLVNEAFTIFLNDHRADHSKAKLAVLDNITTDGRKIVEPDEVPDVELANEGE